MGLGAVLSRVIPVLKPYHKAFGRWYLIFMLWCMASSLLIYTVGLPMPILVSFVYLLISISLGWNAIFVHTARLSEKVRAGVNERLLKIMQNKNSVVDDINVHKLEKQETDNILMKETYSERVLSWRMLHGVAMTFSWCQMVGRTFVTNPFTSFKGCWTYPAYKSMDGSVVAVDSLSDPPFPMPNGTFIAMITIPTVLIITVVCLSTSYCFYKRDLKRV